MRTLIVCIMVSLDGYYEGPEGNVMALPYDEGFDAYNAERLRAADTLLLGRRSYEEFRSYWPPVAEDQQAPLAEREVSRLLDGIDKVVVSDSLAPEDAAWAHTTVVGRAEAHDRIAELKRGPGRDILVFGSRTLWNDLLDRGLVDELHLLIGAGILAAGTPAFPSQPPGSLRLLGTRTWDGSGLLLARYAVTPAAGQAQ